MISAVGLYLLGVLVAFDQLANAILGGDPDETISSRLGKARRGDFGPVVARLTAPIRWAVDAVFRVAFRQSRHCESSIEEDEGARDCFARPNVPAKLEAPERLISG